MGSRFLLLLISIGISVFGMPGLSIAQPSASNPLRSLPNRPIDDPPVASPTTVSGRQPVMKASSAERLPVEQATYGGAWESRNDRAPSRIPVDAPVLKAKPIVRPTTQGVDPEPAIDSTSDLLPIGNMLESFRVNQAVSNRPGEIGKMKSSSRFDQGIPDEAGLLREFDPATELASGELELGNSEPGNLESGKSEAGVVSRFDKSRFNKLLSKLAINTAIVMCVGVGFILVARQWYKGKKPVQRGAEATIQIKSTLRLGPKANLMLIETGDHRLMVACDQNGIKSVVLLTDSFSSTLDSFSDSAAPPTENESAVEPEDSDAALYSMASVGSLEPRPVSTADRRQKNAEDVIRRKMEQALGEQGLKDLFLQTLKSGN